MDENNGAGGGGSGGALWFQAGNAFTNNGQITARGGAGGTNDFSVPSQPNYASGFGGAGAGGMILIDPPSITNNGLIDVSDGNGLSALGGAVLLTADSITNNGSIVGEGDIPEPASLSVFALGATFLAARRRRPAVRI